jgi:hypothetical protein
MDDKIIIESTIPKRFYCSKCGRFYDDSGVCITCNITLIEEEPYTVLRVCDNEECQRKVEGRLEDFKINSTCPICKIGNLIIPSLEKTIIHVVVGREWDGKPRGKVIREKNEKLKEIHSGYSYENQSLKEKCTQLAMDKINS